LTARFNDVGIVNVYAPNGNAVGSDKFDYKLAWFGELRKHLQRYFKPTDPVVVLGDINIAPTPDDVFDSPKHLGGIGHHPAEFEVLDNLLKWGLTDLFRLKTQGPGHYTFWEFVIRNAVQNNLGWRIDHVYGTQPIVDRLIDCWIDKEPRLLEKPSDHTFVILEIHD
jgi:exodeoxyribonuclease-3